MTTMTAAPPAPARLRRVLKTRHLIVHGLVAMVPVSIWGLFGQVHAASGGAVALVYLVGLIAMILTAASYATMVRRVPAAGSVHAYAKAALGQRAGFVAGWMMLLDYVLLPTLLYAFAAMSMSALFPGTPRWAWAVGFVALNLAIALAGISRTTRIISGIVVVEIAFIAYFLIAGSVALAGDPSLLAPTTLPALPDASLIAGALSIAVLSYLGFDAISTLAEETHDRAGARAVRPGVAMVVALVITGGLLATQGWLAESLAQPLLADGKFAPEHTDTAFFEVVGLVISSKAASAFLIVNVLAVGIGNAVTAHTAAARLLFSMARDGRLPSPLAAIDQRGIPRAAVLLLGGISAVLVLFFASRLALISSLVNVGALTGYILVHLSVIAFGLRERRPVMLVLPVLGIAVLLYVLAHSAALAQGVGAIWLIIGIGLAIAQGRARGARR